MSRAPRRCPRPDCDHLAPCPDHGTPWRQVGPRRRLPASWSRIRASILTRDGHACQLRYPDTWETRHGPASCAGVATEVDHIGRPDDHTPQNLRAVCRPCHTRRTQAQARA